nr:hypothetical protein [uncultured Lichenicoccus sp.]
MIDLPALTITCAATAAVLGAGLSIRARLAQRHWWSVDPMGNAIFFALSLAALELVTVFASLGIMTDGGV